MTENKRFTVHIEWFNYDKTEGEITLKDNGQPLLASECIEDVQMVKGLLNELNDEKEAWKQSCCSNSNFNSILLHELDIAQEQGFEVSNPFKRFLEGRGDVE